MAKKHTFTYKDDGAVNPQSEATDPIATTNTPNDVVKEYKPAPNTGANPQATPQNLPPEPPPYLPETQANIDGFGEVSSPRLRTDHSENIQSKGVPYSQNPARGYADETPRYTETPRHLEQNYETDYEKNVDEIDDDDLYEAPSHKKQRVKSVHRGRSVVFVILTLLVVAVIAVGALGFTGIVDISGILASAGVGRGEGAEYDVTSQEQLLFFLTHPSLKSGDTLNLAGNFEINIDEEYGSFLSIPLFNYRGGTISFTGGTLFLSGDTDTDMNQVVLNDTRLIIEAPDAAIKASGLDDTYINAASFNGSAHLKEFDLPYPGARMIVPVTIANTTSATLTNVRLYLTCPGFIFVDGSSYIIDEIPASGNQIIDIPVVATEGGRLKIIAYAVGSSGALEVFGESEYINVFGPGYYSSDIHTHTAESRSERYGSIPGNITSAYENGLSSIISVENEKESIKLSQTDIDNLIGTPGVFEQYTGFELGPQNRHLLIYDSDVRPRSDWNGQVDLSTGVNWSYQFAVDEVIDDGGIAVMPHFFDYESDIIVSLNMALAMRNAQIEILMLSHLYNPVFKEMDNETRVALNVWNAKNVMGGYVFATMSSDNVYSSEVGTRFIKGYMPTLTEKNLYAVLRNGNFYCSTGPELRFDISGIHMGSDETLIWSSGVSTEETDRAVIDEAEAAATGSAIAHIYASDRSPIVSVAIYKYYVVAANDERYCTEVYREDLRGQGVYSYQKDVELKLGNWELTEGEYDDAKYNDWLSRLSKKEFYRVEVVTEKSRTGLEGDYGVALSNPIWTQMGYVGDSNNYADIEKIDNILGSEIQIAPNGTYYMHSKGAVPSLVNVNAGAADTVTVTYHRVGSKTLADYLLVDIYNGGRHTIKKVYLV